MAGPGPRGSTPVRAGPNTAPLPAISQQLELGNKKVVMGTHAYLNLKSEVRCVLTKSRSAPLTVVTELDVTDIPLKSKELKL